MERIEAVLAAVIIACSMVVDSPDPIGTQVMMVMAVCCVLCVVIGLADGRQ